MEEGPSFCRRLREATKDIHDTSDKLVNLKLGVALSDANVWANGLWVFSKIFFLLEKFMESLPALADLNELVELKKTKAFEDDLDFYMPLWRSKQEPEAVAKYLEHLTFIVEDDEPLLLVAYIYHLYMGLLSGGQILSKKRSFFGGDAKGNAVTSIANGTTIGEVKKKLRSVINAMGEEMDLDLQQRVIEEGVTVFKLNNSIIQTVEGVDEIFYKKLYKYCGVLIVIVCILFSFLVGW